MSPPELSPSELAVLELLTEGCRTSEIAKRLSLEYRTVAVMIKTIKSRFNLQSPEQIREFVKNCNNGECPQKN